MFIVVYWQSMTKYKLIIIISQPNIYIYIYKYIYIYRVLVQSLTTANLRRI